MTPLEKKVKLTRQLTLISYFGLLALFAIWYLIITPLPTIMLVHAVPLLAFLPVVLKGNPRGHAWLCFVVLLYFVEAVLAATNTHTVALGLIYSLLSCTLFTAAMYFARWKSQWLKSQ